MIKAQKLDEKNGLAIKFEERTPDAYTAQFNSGEFQLGGSASLLTVGLADVRGVKVTYLFNLFDFWGAVVTSRPDVKTLKDLEGKDVAAAKGTTNWVMFDWFARQLGADTVEIFGGQHRDAGPDRLRAGGPRGGRAALGAGLYDAAVEEARYANHRSSALPTAGRNSPAAAIFPISASPRTSHGPKRTRSWSRNSTPPTRRPPNGSRRIRRRRRN